MFTQVKKNFFHYISKYTVEKNLPIRNPSSFSPRLNKSH